MPCASVLVRSFCSDVSEPHSVPVETQMIDDASGIVRVGQRTRYVLFCLVGGESGAESPRVERRCCSACY